MPKPEKAYPVRLVGTRSYVDAIARARSGDRVAILRERGNPYDAEALVAVNADGETLGYIPRDNWLRRALVDEGRGCRAVVDELVVNLPRVGEGSVQMTLFVTLVDNGPIGERDFVLAD